MKDYNMYIKKLELWGDWEWWEYFSYYNFNHVDRDKVRIILTLETKQEIEKHFHYLTEVGILNGIWPSYLSNVARKIISYLFAGVRYEWHDINCWIWWDSEDFHRTNYGLLKYSFITVSKNIESIMNLEINRILKLWTLLFTFPFFSFQYIVGFICYIMIEFYGEKAFRFID